MKKNSMNIHNNWNDIVIFLWVGRNLAYDNTHVKKVYSVLESEKIEE